MKARTREPDDSGRRLPLNGILAVSERLRHYGLRGSVDRAIQLARKRVSLDERHIWYEFPLEADRPRMRLLPELTLIKAGNRVFQCG